MNIVVDGYNICYKTTGTGDKTVVILQGWGTDLGVYDSVAGVIDGRRNPGMWTDLRIFSADLWK